MVRTLLGHTRLSAGFADGEDSGGADLEWLKLATDKGMLKIPVD